MATHNDLGSKGEQIAVDYLIQKKYSILERNWRYKKAEIDIIALQQDTLAIIEVKTRTTDYFGDPQDFVTQKKIKLLTEAVNEYVITNNLDVEVRFDIIAIKAQNNKIQIEHLENAFYHF